MPPRERGRPPAGESPSDAIADTITAANLNAYRRRAWAYRFISRVSTPGVVYGSPEFLAMPEGPEKWGIAIRAAECWASDGDNLKENLRVELEAARHADKLLEDAAYRRRRDAHRDGWDRPDPRIAAEIEAEWAAWMSGGAA